MDTNQKYGMEDFLVEAQETLDKVNIASSENIKAAKANTKAANFLKWIIALTVFVFLGLYTDIKIGLSTKADAKDVQAVELFLKDGIYREFVTKSDALKAHELQDAWYKSLLTGDSIDQANYEWFRNTLFDKNYRGD